jgi:hypothetical protein
VEGTSAANILETFAQARHAIADHPPVGLNLSFTRTTEETEAAALPLKVGPTADKAALLIIEMCQFDLQTPFRSGSAFSENLQNERGAIDHLGLKRGFKVALLYRRERAVNDD